MAPSGICRSKTCAHFRAPEWGVRWFFGTGRERGSSLRRGCPGEIAPQPFQERVRRYGGGKERQSAHELLELHPCPRMAADVIRDIGIPFPDRATRHFRRLVRGAFPPGKNSSLAANSGNLFISVVHS